MAVSLAFSQCGSLRERCEIGSVRLSHGEADYDEGAVVPVCDWRPLNTREAQRLQAEPGIPDGALIELVRQPLPDTQVEAAPDLHAVAAGLYPFADRWPADFLGCVTNPGDAPTTTEDPATGRRLGLHVDNWDRLPYGRRHEGRRRLCLNLGPGVRYFLLGDREIEEIYRLVHPDPEHHYPHTDDVRRYVARGRPLQCLRIRLEPGDCYLAPTELLPHDGSTLDGEQPSTAAFWLGRWPAGAGSTEP
ncbi:hypothetical protein J1792_23075 [Streptomyces triculaminicus]|uniref:Uncharacterized protein n=1 Tax=Streptomyces triculaminicus TaxID=2816232 RepID=A0A939FT64_9ACTN|nr:hypothetical protein [Streptomyces triculaminicus]MBO0655555.1 hypothetical protein [Streptomyces triculaminicus]